MKCIMKRMRRRNQLIIGWMVGVATLSASISVESLSAQEEGTGDRRQSDRVDRVADDVVEIRAPSVASREPLLVNWLIKNGKSVKAGDVLIKFENGGIEEEIRELDLELAAGRAELIQAKTSVETAELALAEYVNGTHPIERRTLEAEAIEAEVAVEKAGDDDGARAVAEAKLTLAKKKIEVLEQFVLPRMTADLKGQIATATANLNASEAALELVVTRRDKRTKALEKTIVRAPRQGTVVFVQPERLKLGVQVRSQQPLLRLLPETDGGEGPTNKDRRPGSRKERIDESLKDSRG